MNVNDYASYVLRSEAAGQRISGTSMARKSGKTQSWVSNRMTGKVPMGLDDLVMFAALLDIPITAFIPDRGQLSAYLSAPVPDFVPDDELAAVA